MEIQTSTNLSLDYPVIGIRNFSYSTTKEGWMQSLFRHDVTVSGGEPPCDRYQWLPGVNKAYCHIAVPLDAHNPSAIAAGNCGCGFYAYHEYGKARIRALSPLRLMGIIRGWGNVRVHPDGWRAQFAEILALITDYSAYYDRYLTKRQQGDSQRYSDAEMRKYIQDIANRYQVPAVSAHALPDIALEFGRPVPVRMRPPYQPFDQEKH